MSAFLAMVRKNLLDSRWLLGIMGLALFWLCWLFVYQSARVERMVQAGAAGRMRMLRGLGGASMDFSSAAIEMSLWNLPFIPLMYAIWAIARGSSAVGGEIEKGTMDLVLSRPVSRSSFLAAQVTAAFVGFLVMASLMIAGSLVGAHFNTLETPPPVTLLAKPALNLMAFGFAIYGYTLLLSTVDLCRWRPNLIASVATLAGFIAQIVATMPTMENYKWLEKVSVFKAYNPVEVVTKGESFVFNSTLLGSIGLAGALLGLILFSRRDIPAGS